MLRRTPSLALRAVLTFSAVYIAALACFLGAVVVINDPTRDRNGHVGPKIVLSRAAKELVRKETGFRIVPEGDFAELASKNPKLWLILRSGHHLFSWGQVPEPVTRVFKRQSSSIQSGRFYVPGLRRPLANAFIDTRKVGAETVLIGAGGVDPRTLGFADALGASWGEGVLVILAWIAGVGLAAMLIALPILSRALRPLAAQATAIRPEEPARRIDEHLAPRELLPVVRGFNAALDRLAFELGRRKRFIADAAHELRTPLATVALRVEALEDETAKQELRRGLGRLVHLVSQMLDVERLTLSGQDRALLNLTDLARDVVADLAPTVIRSGYDLSLEAPDAPIVINGDAHAIARAITNLISNAVAHGGGSGQISVVLAENKTIDVVDEGPGVPEALIPRLFEPFSRGNQDSDGCGLGLHLTREIMRAHGGDACIVNRPQGAVFRLSFEFLDESSPDRSQ